MAISSSHNDDEENDDDGSSHLSLCCDAATKIKLAQTNHEEMLNGFRLSFCHSLAFVLSKHRYDEKSMTAF